MQETKATPEEGFRSVLEDVVIVVEKLTTHCKTPEEMVGMIQCALQNDGQLRLLMSVVQQKR